jgi:hypothetical protein
LSPARTVTALVEKALLAKSRFASPLASKTVNVFASRVVALLDNAELLQEICSSSCTS